MGMGLQSDESISTTQHIAFIPVVILIFSCNIERTKTKSNTKSIQGGPKISH